ncbi:uncharacterized protein LOC116206747 isoform X2 [Punica granatum]|uniref:Uncharacterized protein LOC116206747 isoform X2 n=1 Tax=Punica granatum TaxID=22663 RepID=A0A6P8DTH4_PUNGR|nr:uncharacterized protein LOC116206747 isoform X2 [Punica granatum]
MLWFMFSDSDQIRGFRARISNCSDPSSDRLIVLAMATVPGVDAQVGPSLPPAKRSNPEEEEYREIVKKNRIEEDKPVVEEDSSEEDDLLDENDLQEYYRAVAESEGYDCGDLSKYKFQYWMLSPMSKVEHEEIKGFVVEALNGYNKNEGTQLVFEMIEKANIATPCVATYYVTYVVKGSEDGDRPKTFQCRIHEFLQGFEVEQIRPKPAAA